MTVYICKTCGRQNSANLTFCEECGARLTSLAAAPTPMADAPGPFHPAAHTPAVVGSPPFHPSMPTPAIDLGANARSDAGASVRPALRLCQRCQGSSLPTAQFCKFCGAPFTASLAPAPPRVAAIASAPAVSVGPVPPMAQPPVVQPPVMQPPVMQPMPATPARDLSPVPRPVSPIGGADAAPYAPATHAPVPRAASPGTAPLAVVPAVGAAPLIRVTSISKDGAERESYAVTDLLDLGRTEGEARFAEDRYLSPRHARIFTKEGRAYLQDLGSVNGTYYRLKQAPIPLVDQDLILLGQQVIRFELVNREDWPGPGCEHSTLLFGTPGARPYARLAQRGMEGIAMNVFYLRAAETTIGREIGDVVFTDDPFMSRRHAVIRRDDRGQCVLADVGSSNGTFMKIREPVALSVGDEFRIGQQLFRINQAEGAR